MNIIDVRIRGRNYYVTLDRRERWCRPITVASVVSPWQPAASIVRWDDQCSIACHWM